MSGHSKWHSIKYKKGITDQRRGKVFTKVSSMIAIAAKIGGGDPDTNPRLELAISKAREINMSKDKIKQAIKRGTGELAGTVIESATYEGYGPFGIALIIDVITDNKNRTLSSLRRTLTENGGKLGKSGSVAYLFEKKGLITIETKNLDPAKKEELELTAIDAGAEDVDESEATIDIYTNPKELNQVKTKLEAAGFKTSSSDLIMDPKNTLEITKKDKAQKVIAFIEKLEEIDDISKVHSNFDIPEELV
ncbi:YebC/PmpR family DNA-binding transcriptional regulator [Patescibacteria group bacterium]|nr:MAG: YebC/PmpR family DNA-binding transcriptional regulator [Patescibacteria group bacterium]